MKLRLEDSFALTGRKATDCSLPILTLVCTKHDMVKSSEVIGWIPESDTRSNLKYKSPLWKYQKSRCDECRTQSI